MKIALAQINPIIGAFDYNCKKIIANIFRAKNAGARLVVFPELAISGYPPEDLLLLPAFLRAATNSLEAVIAASEDIAVIVGCVRPNPYQGEKRLFNSAAFIQNKELVAYQDKILLPDYDVFSERRYFEPGGHISCWSIEGKRVGITICEDIWQHANAVEYSNYLRDPVDELKNQELDVMINLSASPYYMRRHETRLEVCVAAAKSLKCPVLLCNQVGGNDSLIFDGYSLCVHADGSVFAYGKGFEEDLIIIDLAKDNPSKQLVVNPIEDLWSALVLGVRDYFQKLGWKKACFGLSGGIDSAVVAAIAAEALGRENLLALMLPSRFTSQESKEDALMLSKSLNIPYEEIPIEKPFEAFLEILAPYFAERTFDATEENLQARIRGVLLMAFSNKFNYLLLSTGNKSEMAMGYATLYGDMCGGLSVLSDVSKAQVYALALYINRHKEVIPASIIQKPPSAELRANQKDTDSLPPYSVVDTVLEAYVEKHFSPEEISAQYQISLTLVKELVCKIHLNEYKRRQAPPGLRVTKRSFTVGRRFPIVQHWNMEKS